MAKPPATVGGTDPFQVLARIRRLNNPTHHLQSEKNQLTARTKTLIKTI